MRMNRKAALATGASLGIAFLAACSDSPTAPAAVVSTPSFAIGDITDGPAPEAAPERIIWGSDWPHPQWTKRMMNDAEEVELLYRYVDGDTELLRKILVDNPAKLHGFND